MYSPTALEAGSQKQGVSSAEFFLEASEEEPFLASPAPRGHPGPPWFMAPSWHHSSLLPPLPPLLLLTPSLLLPLKRPLWPHWPFLADPEQSPLSKPLTAKSLFTWKVTHHQVQGVRMWAFWGARIHMTTAGEGWGHVLPPGQVQKSCLCLRGTTPWCYPYPKAPCQPDFSQPPGFAWFFQACPVSLSPFQVSPSKSRAQESCLRLCF